MMERPKTLQAKVFSIGLSVILALFSTVVMSYISMAAVIGPWVAPVLVLVAMVVLLPFVQNNMFKNSIALVVSASSVGGILATALGFSFPTLFFLNQKYFNVWMEQPVKFCLTLSALVLSAGALAFMISYIIKDYLIVHRKLRFPVGKLVYNMIYVQDQKLGMMKMLSGMSFSFMYNVITTRFISFFSFISTSALHMGPLLFAIGFVAGGVMAVPLLVGMLSRIFVVDILRSEFFSLITEYDFVIAFCSGIVISSAVMGVVSLVKNFAFSVNKYKSFFLKDLLLLLNINRKTVAAFSVVVLMTSGFLYGCGFNIVEQVYLITFTVFAAFYMAVIAGSIGLAQLGRFATFVMLPAMYLFELNNFQVVIISTFVSLCTGITVDLLFGYKLAELAHISYKRIVRYQVLGFVVAALAVGVIFWLYIHHFGLGTPELFAQKAQSRSLLIQLNVFDYAVVLCGVLYGLLIAQMGMSPLLVFGGIVMPSYMVLWLVIAGALSYFVYNKEQMFPFFFGMYTLHAIWMMGAALCSCVIG